LTATGQRLVATVRGYVQGVGFRWYVQREAARLDLVGWVSNCSDGSVEIVAEGPDPSLGQLLLQLWEGPSGASVSDVAVRYEPARGNLIGFVIRSGAHSGD
jgi:acylphosphatase